LASAVEQQIGLVAVEQVLADDQVGGQQVAQFAVGEEYVAFAVALALDADLAVVQVEIVQGDGDQFAYADAGTVEQLQCAEGGQVVEAAFGDLLVQFVEVGLLIVDQAQLQFGLVHQPA